MMKRIRNKLPAQLGVYLGTIFSVVPSTLYSSVITYFLISRGLNMTQIGFLWSIELFISSMLDFPTGGLADRFGRIHIFSLGLFMYGLSNITYAFADSYAVFIIAAVLAGGAESQITGTIKPWYFDRCKTDRNEVHLKVMGNSQILSSVAGIVTGLIISSVLVMDLSTTLYVAGIIYMIGAFLAILLLANDKKASVPTLRTITFDSLKLFIRSKFLILYALIWGCLFSYHTVYQFIWQLVAINVQIDSSRLGAVTSVYILFSGIGGFITGRITRANAKYKAMIIAMTFCALSLSLIAIANSQIVFWLSIIWYGFSYGFLIPIVNVDIQQYIPDELRSATNSLISTVSTLIIVVMQFVMGYTIDLWGLNVVILWLGVILICSIYIIAQMNKGEAK